MHCSNLLIWWDKRKADLTRLRRDVHVCNVSSGMSVQSAGAAAPDADVRMWGLENATGRFRLSLSAILGVFFAQPHECDLPEAHLANVDHCRRLLKHLSC